MLREEQARVLRNAQSEQRRLNTAVELEQTYLRSEGSAVVSQESTEQAQMEGPRQALRDEMEWLRQQEVFLETREHQDMVMACPKLLRR